MIKKGTILSMNYCLYYRVMDVCELIPQMNPGGSGRIMKPELRQLLNRLMFYMDDMEFEKLWNK